MFGFLSIKYLTTSNEPRLLGGPPYTIENIYLHANASWCDTLKIGANRLYKLLACISKEAATRTVVGYEFPME